MKSSLIFALLIVVVCQVSNGQETIILQPERATTRYYQHYASMGIGYPFLLTGAFTVIYDHRWGVSTALKNIAMPARNAPEDIRWEEQFWNKPMDILWIWSVNYTREFKTWTPKAVAGLEVGPSLTWYTELCQFGKVGPGPPGDDSTFFYSYVERNSVNGGISARASLGFPPAFKDWGFEFAVVANLSPRKSMIGFEVCMTYGRFR